MSSLEGNLLSLVQVSIYKIFLLPPKLNITENLSQFLVVMLATLVVCSTILYCAASINVAKVYLHIMKEYGWPFGKP